MIVSRCIAVILHFRTAQMTFQCIHALVSEGIDGIIVVDNSEDNGRSVAKLAERAASARVRIKYIEPGRNLGFGGGVNLALGYMASEMPGADALLVNSDAIITNGSLQRLRKAVAGSAPSLAAPAIDIGAEVVPAAIYYRHFSGIISPKAGGLREHVLLCGACLMVHHDLVAPDLFDEAFFFYGEDIEMAYRLQARGIPLNAVDDALVFHSVSGSARNGSIFYEYHINRAHILLIRRLGMGFAGQFAMTLGRMGMLPARALVRSIRFRSLVAWKGLFLAVLDILVGRTRTLTPAPSLRQKD